MASGPDLGPTPDDPNHHFYEQAATARHYREADGLSRAERPLFKYHLCAGMDILDLGVGAGRTTPHLSELADRYVGVDYAEPMVEACRERFPHLELYHADAADLSFLADRSFDAVVFPANGIDYLPSDTARLRCLAECHRLLRRGGVLILSRHNPRAIIRRPDLHGAGWRRRARLRAAVPVWAVRRAVRLVPHRAFWSGVGPVAESPLGFTGPLRSHGRRREADDRPDLVTHMAVPRVACAELRRAGFTVTAVAGGVDPERTGILSTPNHHYVGTKLSHLARSM